jgi:TonB family protein
MLLILLKLTLAWGFFALLYAALLRRETFFRANRAYLLVTAMLGPILSLPLWQWYDWPYASPVAEMVLPAVSAGATSAASALMPWSAWFAGIYLAGVLAALLRTGVGIFRLFSMARSGKRSLLPGGVVLIATRETNVPFSFFKWVFVPRDFERDTHGIAMLAHECAHARGMHSVDVLFFELLCAACWFHPLAHWYRRSIRSLHEYLADAEACNRTDKKEYGLLLIRQAVPGMQPAFVNHFFQSPLKQRLLMLTRVDSPAARMWKYALVLPLSGFLFAFAAQRPEPESQGANVIGLSEIEQAPQFPGGMAALMAYMGKNLLYPDAAKKEKAEGLVALSFVVGTDGKVSDVAAQRKEGEKWRQDFEDEAIRVARAMPDWSPGYAGGRPVRVRLTLPVRFRLR